MEDYCDLLDNGEITVSEYLDLYKKELNLIGEVETDEAVNAERQRILDVYTASIEQ